MEPDSTVSTDPRIPVLAAHRSGAARWVAARWGMARWGDSAGWDRAARALLQAIFAVNVYRAATQSITPSEAQTYNRFVGPPLREALVLTTANNHVLNTLLARISTGYFHLTDLAFRLPSLVGGALYLWAVYRLSRRTFGATPLFLAAVALLALNPLVLDHLSAARGYGMALAFWMWALELMLEVLESDAAAGSRRLNLAGVCLGLSVASNLAFFVPAFALACTFEWSRFLAGPAAAKAGPAAQGQAPTPGLGRWQLLLPAFVTAFLLLVIPLNHVDLATFNVGATSLRQTVQSIAALSLFHGNPAGLPRGLAAVVRIGLGILAVAVLLASAPRLGLASAIKLVAPFAVFRWRAAPAKKLREGQNSRPSARLPAKLGEAPKPETAGERARVESLQALLAGAMLLIFVILELAHRFFRVPFPVNRSALYFIPATTLAALALVRHMNRRPVEFAAIIVAIAWIVVYIVSFNIRIYSEWPAYAESRSLVKAIRRDVGVRHIRIWATPAMEPVLNYYRARYHLGNWDPVGRQALPPTPPLSGPQAAALGSSPFSGPPPATGSPGSPPNPGSPPLPASYDYYVLRREDAGWVEPWHLRLVYGDGNFIVAR